MAAGTATSSSAQSATTAGASSLLLRRALIADALITGATGALMLAGAGPLHDWLDLPTALLRWAGLFLIGYAGLVTRQECLLVVVGGVFVIETLSVMVQVIWFRRTGTRILACSPLHNHYLFKGHHEMKIVVRFWITAALLAIVALASLKLR